ncbi:PP2C family protein-serine/threonine phosphatase [Nafulsella turpanensis]|uniref:PP2C family protein-serine/threonine phosphatase n=1 Tax=Nafulsella turpanensis TaxID=1265690 RepID=UPI0003493A69|nr:SpoIIE family protein phosphatase [Nafulsella turpanensis]
MYAQEDVFIVVGLCGVLVVLTILILLKVRGMFAHFLPNPPVATGEELKQAFSMGLPDGETAISSELEKLNQLVAELKQTRKELEQQKEKLEEALLLVEKDNFRKTEELWEAQQLQLSMLPRQTPFYPGYEIALFSRPATEVGGDYYDYSFEEAGKNLHIVLGDATGHGYKPGILVATAKSYFQTLSGKSKAEDILQKISEAILSLNARGLYMGLSLLKIDGDLIEMVSSGMPPVLYYQSEAQGGKVQQHSLKGMFLSVAKNQKGNRKYFRMHSGDVLLLMTDGLAEAQNKEGELYGFEAVKNTFELLAPLGAGKIIRGLMEAGEGWRGEKGFRDDVSLIVIRRK